jgi:hypothetical protein
VASSAAAVLIVVVVIVVAVARRPGHGNTKAGPERPSSAAPSGSSSPVPTPSASANGPLLGEAAQWAEFPVKATPRPVVLIGQAILDPRTGFRDGDSKEAYIEGRFTLATTLPDAPATRDGYQLSSAADAVQQIETPSGKGPGTPLTLQITDVRLVEQTFDTDRGKQALPAWQLRIAGVDYPAYVLAVAAAEQFDPVAGQGDGGLSITVGADARELTVPFIARHTSTGPCDAGFTQTLHVSQTPTVVVLDIETVSEQPSPSPTPVACDLIGRPLAPDPGEPADRTVTLDSPLGARVVVSAHGVPIEVTT